MTELIQMRVKALAAILVLTLLMPTAAAHGANTFSFIMRSESVQPESAQVLQNDTLIFHNVVDYERNISLEGPYGEEVCTAGPSSPGTEDECRFWLDPEKYGPETYGIQIFSNGSWWKEVVVTIVLDNHTETLPPDGFVFGPDPDESGDTSWKLPYLHRVVFWDELLSVAVLLAGAAAFVWVIRNVKGDEEQ